jgi:hypothetical protein
LIPEATNEMTTKSRPATPLIRHRVADETMTRLHVMPAILALEALTLTGNDIRQGDAAALI